jgi:hypothetical protein
MQEQQRCDQHSKRIDGILTSTIESLSRTVSHFVTPGAIIAIESGPGRLVPGDINPQVVLKPVDHGSKPVGRGGTAFDGPCD